MGVVKDGSISGLLPTTEVFAVHYPAYPSSIERAVETLGGAEAIAKVRCSGSNKLELHFRPEDPYSHPAHGQLRCCNNFLLKISRKKIREEQNVQDNIILSKCSSADLANHEQKRLFRDSTETAQQISECRTGPVYASAEGKAQMPQNMPESLHADIVSHVREAYHFNGMVDYQHVLAVHADVARRKKRNWAEVEPQFEKGGLMDVDQEDVMILVPPLFSVKDTPEKVALKPSIDLSLKKKQEGVVQHRWEMDIEPSLAIDFNIKEIPKKVNWEKYIPEGSEQWEWQTAVCELFDERPIWKKDSLAERLSDRGLTFGGNMLRRLLFRAAYYFSNGPFLRFWIKKGYDPRKDPESRVYQRIDFRVPPSLRSYCDANIASGLKHRWTDICAFQVFPHKCQTSLQLCELDDDYIREEIRKPSNQATCTCATGWFSSRVLDTMRFCVAVRFLSVYPGAGAESLLKSARDRFEKSKRMRVYTKDPQVGVEGQHNNKEVVDNEDKGPSEDEENEEYDIEDDNVEEDVDAYEALDPDGQEGEFSPRQYPDQDNISRNYLQELFGSFPFNTAGLLDASQDADNDDGEFQIYEQFSDGNYSDDED